MPMWSTYNDEKEWAEMQRHITLKVTSADLLGMPDETIRVERVGNVEHIIITRTVSTANPAWSIGSVEGKK